MLAHARTVTEAQKESEGGRRHAGEGAKKTARVAARPSATHLVACLCPRRPPDAPDRRFQRVRFPPCSPLGHPSGALGRRRD